VIVVSNEENFFESVKATLLRDARFIDLGDDLHCDGLVAPVTNIYPVDIPDVEWDGWEPTDKHMPDPRSMSALVFECRTPAWIAEVGSLLAQCLPSPVWFVDAADVAWPAGQVDVDHIALA
jgi:hypothetical protein